MATDSVKTVHKLPANSESKADRVLTSARAEKVVRNGHLYHIALSSAFDW